MDWAIPRNSRRTTHTLPAATMILEVDTMRTLDLDASHRRLAIGGLALGIALLIAAAGCKGSSPTTSSGGPAAGGVEAVFQVDGMTCSSCNVAVKLAAEKVNGVDQARASHDEKRAWVHYDPAKTNPEAIATAITNAGYKTTPLPASGGS